MTEDVYNHRLVSSQACIVIYQVPHSRSKHILLRTAGVDEALVIKLGLGLCGYQSFPGVLRLNFSDQTFHP